MAGMTGMTGIRDNTGQLWFPTPFEKEDIPGLLQHVKVRGIERRDIFHPFAMNAAIRNTLLSKLGALTAAVSIRQQFRAKSRIRSL